MELSERLRNWSEFAWEARTYGEWRGFEDYFNDVSTRDIVERKRIDLADADHELLMTADRQFFLGHTRVTTTILDGKHWRQFRVPAEPGEDLARDIEQLPSLYVQRPIQPSRVRRGTNHEACMAAI